MLVLSLLTACGGDSEEPRFSIGGTITGLSSSGLVLQSNNGDDLVFNTDGSFSFATELKDGSTYEVTISSQPGGQTCSVINGNGTLDGADVTNVLISCPPNAVTPGVSAVGPKVLRFAWNDVGADHYRLFKNPDGSSGYTQVGGEIRATRVDEEISVHLTDWVNVSYLVQACNVADVCTDSAPISATSIMLDVIGYLKEPDYRRFGTRLALSDDAQILAISSDSGVHIYQRNGASWNQQTVLDFSFISDLSISSSGDTLALGFSLEQEVYIYVRNGTIWNQQAFLKALNTESGDGFATFSLSGNGDLLAVAAPREDSAAVGINGDQTDNSATDAGAVYLFERRENVWQQQAYIKASNTDSNDEFGRCIALSTDGNTLAVAASYEDSSATRINGDQTDNSALDSGAVYLFVRNDNGGWQQQAYIKASNTGDHEYFGKAISLSGSGDLLAVGAFYEGSSATGINGDQTDNSASRAGAVYLFERNMDIWTQTTYIKASNAEAYDYFGNRVELSTDGNTLAVTASAENSLATGINGDQTNDSSTYYPPGAVYVFTRTGTDWFQQAYVKASNTDEGWVYQGEFFANDNFGESLALSRDGTTLVVGARNERSGDRTNQQDNSSPWAGAVYLY
ncbi:MAG: FG-GAP repeat protein [Candidatus Thiodiazotropha sp. (ex Lucinoma borealis)]|nr:FG-GAP repeat protein [Candidatus Thiodiazotropha sp. (ex Lucinoma borealis)]